MDYNRRDLSRGRDVRGKGRPTSHGAGHGGSPAFKHAGARDTSASMYNPSPPSLDPNLEKKEEATMALRLKKVSTKPNNLGRVTRREYGKKGLRVLLRTNYFKLEVPEKLVLYEYELKISPELDDKSSRLRKRIFELFDESEKVKPFLKKIAHDKAKRLVALQRLPSDFSVDINYCEKGKKGSNEDEKGKKGSNEGEKVYTIKVEEKNTLSLSDMNQYVLNLLSVSVFI